MAVGTARNREEPRNERAGQAVSGSAVFPSIRPSAPSANREGEAVSVGILGEGVDEKFAHEVAVVGRVPQRQVEVPCAPSPIMEAELQRHTALQHPRSWRGSLKPCQETLEDGPAS
jgi:hypothetical protein